MADDKDKKGFSGLSSLASDIDEAVAEKAHQEVKAKRPAEAQRKDKGQLGPGESAPTPRRTPPPESDWDVAASGTSHKPTPGSSGARWFWGLVGVGVLLWLFSLSFEDGREPGTSTSYTPPSPVPGYPASQTPGAQISDLEFSKPPVGDNNVLSVAQIRWCLREDIRIEVLRPKPMTNAQIDQFNEVVADYNRRCGSYRYRQGTLSRAQQEVERVRAQIIASVSAPWEAAVVTEESVSQPGLDFSGLVPLLEGAVVTDESVSQRPSVAPAQPSPAQWSQLTLDVQNALKGLGYDPGPSDGLYGAKTRAAIEKFERALGLRVTGHATPELLIQLREKMGSLETNSRPLPTNVSSDRTTRLVPTEEEQNIARSACAGKKALYGPAAYEFCVAEKLVELEELGRRPNLGGVSSSERSAIINACAGKKVLYGPASYYTCIEEKLVELASVGRAPTFSGMSASERSAIENACAGKKAIYGPASYYECVREKISELKNSGGVPDFGGVSRSEREAIENACAGKKVLHGPAAFYACARGMIDELRQLSTRPDFSRVSYVDRSAIENACAGKKAMYGPAAFYRCVEQQIGALQQ